MAGNKGWQTWLVVASVSCLVLSTLAVGQETGRWRAVGKESLAYHRVGIQPNGKCCEHATKVGCVECLVNPQCPANTWSQGFCTNGSKAFCAQEDNRFCDEPGGINKSGTISVQKCWLTGNKVSCGDDVLICELDTTRTQSVNVNYTDCGGGNIDICTVQPFPACSLK